MATAKQIAANRLNSQKTTGPRTTRGKSVSRFNALKHGIYAVQLLMFDEKAEDLAELSAEYYEHHTPADARQSLLVDALVHNEWRLRRMRRVEAILWYRAHDACLVKNIEVTLTCTSGDAFATDSSTFERLQRLVNSCERAYHRALKELQTKVGQALPPANPDPHSQPAAPAPSIPPQPQQSKASSAKLVSFRQKPQTPAPPATPVGPAAQPADDSS
ncbi:MAG: hypothetical protein ABSG03_42220 [Bryobacteraceae bacterium]